MTSTPGVLRCRIFPQKLNITLPGYLLNRIDEYVLHHPEEKSRSGFLASAALKVLQQGR